MHAIIRNTLLGGLAVGLVGSAIAADLTPEEQIQTRQAGYRFMSWNMSKIKANLDGDYSQPRVEAAANAIAGIANSGMGVLFAPGTEQDIGEVKTRVKPELFTNQEEVAEVAVAFIEAANSMAETAALGSEDEVRAAFGKLGQSCKGCHDKFRKD